MGMDDFILKRKGKKCKSCELFNEFFIKYKNLRTEELKKEKAIITTQISNDDFWINRYGPSRLFSFIAITIAICGFLLSLLNYSNNINDDCYDIIILILIVALVILMFLVFLHYSILYDKLEPDYIQNKLKLEVINQVLEERQVECKAHKTVKIHMCDQKLIP